MLTNIAAAGVNDATFNGDVQSVIGPWRPLIKIGENVNRKDYTYSTPLSSSTLN